MAAEYILKEGNEKVMLCERGIRTFETAYRFTLDLMAVPVLKQLTHLPIVVDPSHAAGPARPRRAAVARRGRRGRRRHHRRGAPAPRGGDLRRAAGAARRGVRRVRPEGRAGRGDRRQEAVRSQRAGRDGAALNVAVVGTGLIGGSVGLAARQRLGAHVRGTTRPQGAARRASSARSTRPAATSRRRSTAPTSRSSARPSACCRSVTRDVLARRPGGLRRHRRRLDQARRRRRGGDDERFVGGHPLAGAEVSGVEHAREDLFDGATWYLTPHRRRPAACCSSACTGSLHRARRASGGRRPRRPRPHDGRRLPPAARARERPRRAGRRRARRRARCPRHRARASATPRAWPGANPALWTGIYAPTATRSSRRSTPRSRACSEVRARARGRRRRVRSSAWQARAADRRARCSRPASPAARVRELRAAVPNRPGVIADIALDARPRRHEHRRHGAAPLAGQQQRRGRAVGRRATSADEAARADPRRSASPVA